MNSINIVKGKVWSDAGMKKEWCYQEFIFGVK